MDTVTLTVTRACNFRCAHCLSALARRRFYPAARPGPMDFQTAARAIDWVAAGLKETDRSLHVSFNGGEPLLMWPLIRRIVAHAKGWGNAAAPVRFAINTNAALITPAIARFLRRHRFAIVTSLDGPPAGNNRIRRDARGGPTYRRIIRGFDRLAAAGLPVRGAHVVMTSANLPHLNAAFLRRARRRGFLSVTLEPDFTAPLRLTPEALADRLMALRRAGQRLGMTVVGLWERPYARIAGPERHAQTHFCHDLSGDTLSVLPDGTLCACAFSDTRLGHLDDAIRQGSPSDFQRSPPVRRLTESRRAGRIAACRGCEIEGVCAGGCHAIASHARWRGEPAGADFHCAFYRAITRRLLQAAAVG